jgi:hypothetical protein
MAAIDIHVKGLDEVLRKLGEEEEGLTVPKLNEWAQKILEEARLRAGRWRRTRPVDQATFL